MQQSQLILFFSASLLNSARLVPHVQKREAVTKSVTTSLYILMLVPLHLKLYLAKKPAMTMWGVAVVAVVLLDVDDSDAVPLVCSEWLYRITLEVDNDVVRVDTVVVYKSILDSLSTTL